METKDEKLDKLDTMLIDAMTTIMEKGQKDPEAYGSLSDLATVSNYLAKNNKVAEKKKSTVEDDIRARKKAAEDRRKKREQEQKEQKEEDEEF